MKILLLVAVGWLGITAQQVIDRIQKNLGVPLKKETVDTFKAGDPETAITGIATTMMATQDVLARAAASGKNLVITHEPTFYNHFEKTDGLAEKENDPVLAAKRKFIAEHRLVIWRFHDYQHAMKPDQVVVGMVRALGWEKFQDANNLKFFKFPETTLAKFAAGVKKKLGIRVMRVVGDPAMKVARAAITPGATGIGNETKSLAMDGIDVLLTGETREWETVEYAADAMAQGKRKALIILGHIPSEQAGMEEAARWIKTFVNEVPVEFIPAAEPFWGPK